MQKLSDSNPPTCTLHRSHALSGLTIPYPSVLQPDVVSPYSIPNSYKWGDPPSPKSSSVREEPEKILSKVDIARLNRKINGKLKISKKAVKVIQDALEGVMNKILQEMEECMLEKYTHKVEPGLITYSAATSVKRLFPGKLEHQAHKVATKRYQNTFVCPHVYDRMIEATWENSLPKDYEEKELSKKRSNKGPHSGV